MNLDLTQYSQAPHFPVLLQEVLQALNTLSAPAWVVDCTFGAGYYSEAILTHSRLNVIAIDRDPSCQTRAHELKQRFGHRFTFSLNTFSNLSSVLEGLKITQVGAIVADLGVSSMQLDQPARGFSFMSSGDLSMAMGLNKLDAKDFLNTAEEALIAKVLWEYSEERKARAIARAIVKCRASKLLTTTQELRQIIHQAIGYAVTKKGKDSATKAFQAIRIHVNDELGELIALLNTLPLYLAPEGCGCLVSFHSLEDRIVKLFFKDLLSLSEHAQVRYPQQGSITLAQLKAMGLRFSILNPTYLHKNNKSAEGGGSIPVRFSLFNQKPITPTEEELFLNRRSSSAKLRVITRL